MAPARGFLLFDFAMRRVLDILADIPRTTMVATCLGPRNTVTQSSLARTTTDWDTRREGTE